MTFFICLVADILIPLLMIGAKKSNFVKEYLKSDEIIIAKAQNSEFIVLLIIFLMAVINIIAISQNVKNNYGSSGFLGTMVCLLSLILVFGLVVNNYCREFVVTNKRIVLKKGILSRDVKEFRYDKLESCDVNQSIVGRVLEFGTIILHGTGGSKAEESFIQDPYKFRQHLIDKIV